MIGANGGGNLNIFVFEVGIVTVDPVTGVETVTTVSVHPLVVAPRMIRYQDASRSAVMETTGGSLVTRSGRALRSVTMEGMFGTESRGLAGYIGTGEVRFQRFYKEVVRMSDALRAGDVQAAVDTLNGTPFIKLLVKPFVEGLSRFYINFYDFWHDISFQCLISTFAWSREHRNGGATGNIPYNMLVREVGPLKEGGLGNTIISGLLAALGTWDDINDVIESYTPSAILDSIVGVAAIGLSELADTVAAVNAQAQSVQELMGGSTAASLVSSASNEGITSFFANCTRLESQGVEAVTALNQALGTGEFDAPTGSVDWPSTKGEGSDRGYDLFEQLVEVERVIDAAAFYKAAGVLFGMSRQDYQAFILGGGVLGLLGPNVSGSARYTVTATDSPDAIELRFGVTWAAILEANNLTPDEALYPGAELRIPVQRPKGPQGVRGLPTFGSHLGASAWGVDIPLELAAAEDGNLILVSDEDVLEQGATFIVEQFADGLLRAAQTVPDQVKPQYLSRRLSAMFMLDGRFQSTDDIVVEVDADGAFNVEATLHAINGGTITTGGSA